MADSDDRQDAWQRLAANVLISVAYLYAVGFTVLFLPGNLSLDSFQQYEQAVTGVFHDHHPPVMAICLHLAMRVGLGIQTLTALQVAGGLVGVHLLLRAGGGFFAAHRAVAPSRLGQAVALVLLVSPLTPLLYYLTTFWKDTWFFIALVWTATALLWDLVPECDRVPRVLALPTLLAGVVGMMLSRHNGVVLLPVLALILLFRRPIAFRRNALVVVGMLILVFGSSRALYAGFDVERRYLHQNYVMWYDVLALCEEGPDPDGCREDLIGDAAAQPQDAFLSAKADLFYDWMRAVAAHPLTLIRLKLEMFAGTLNLGTPPHDYFHAEVLGAFRVYGIERDPTWAALRASLIAFTRRAVELPLLASLLGGHAVWFAMSLAGTFVVGWKSWRRRVLAPSFGLFALPLAYYVSYLPMFTVGDFRYLYPSTAFSQVIALAWVTARFAGAGATSAASRRELE